jgi:hypothetical protein
MCGRLRSTHTVLIRNPEGNRPVPLICGMVMFNQTLKKGMEYMVYSVGCEYDPVMDCWK